MNLLVPMLFGLLAVPFIPAIIEYFARKDKGPRDMPEKTTDEGELIAAVPRLERARGKARARVPGEVIRIVGDVSIPDGTEMDKHLVIHGSLNLGKGCRIDGTVKAFGKVVVGENSIVEGHILSQGRVCIGAGAIIKGIVDSSREIILEQNAVVGIVSTEKTVKLRSGARINRRIVRSDLEWDMQLKRPRTGRDLQISALETANERLRSQQGSDQADVTDENATPLTEPHKRLSEEELFERLLASKIRGELKRKIEVETRQSQESKQEKDNEKKVGKMFVLPILTLSTLLLTEVAYYSPSPAMLLEAALPFGVKTWFILLLTSIGFGAATIFYTLRNVSRWGRLSQGHSAESQESKT